MKELYVLMTGLMENIRNIKDKKSLTFLYRAKMSEFDATLAELSYDKIWDELSATDIRILKAMLEISEAEGEVLIKVDKIRERTEMTSDTFTKYRTRLLDSGVVDGSTYGHLKFSLPRFEEYIRGRG